MGVPCSRHCLKSEARENEDIGQQAKPTSRNEIEALQRNRPNDSTAMTEMDSFERNESFNLPDFDTMMQDLNVYSIKYMQYLENQKSCRSNVNTGMTKMDSSEESEPLFGLPRSNSSTGNSIINYGIPDMTYQDVEINIPYRENEIENLNRTGPNVNTEMTDSSEESEHFFGLPRRTNSTGNIIINYGIPDRTNKHVESDIPSRKNSMKSLRSNPSNTDRTTRISVHASECSIRVPRSESNLGNVIINDYRTPDRTSLVAESNNSYMGVKFTCGHTTASFQRYVQKKRNDFPAGNFIDCRNVIVRNSVSELHELVKWSHSVCQIRFGNCTATGFRVGSKYVMTALHVVETINREYSVYESEVPLLRNSKLTALAHRDVFCLFDYFKENQDENGRKHFFKRTLHFYDEETDTAVLELIQNQKSIPLSPPFQEFGLPDVGGKFTFLGHEGRAMEHNMVDLIIDKDHERTNEDITYVKDYSNGLTSEPYELPPHNFLTNEHRLLFHCKFGKGASGSPGLSVQENGRVVVVTMLLCGYPNWYYDQTVDSQLLQQWPKEYCIEQGADMMSVGKKMYMENPDLYREIFRSYNIPVPNIY